VNLYGVSVLGEGTVDLPAALVRSGAYRRVDRLEDDVT
jgi:hypothetical protein